MSLDYTFKEPQLYPGTLRGYRRWVASHHPSRGPVFKALSYDTTWLPGINKAVCQVRRDSLQNPLQGHNSPVRDCTCGFYATYDHQGFPGAQDSYAPWAYPPRHVGSVRASGRIILGTKGFRAEKIEVEALVAPQVANGAHEKLAELYGVPLYSAWIDLLVDFPPVDVEALIGPLPPKWKMWADQHFFYAWSLSDEDAQRMYVWAEMENGGHLSVEVSVENRGYSTLTCTNARGQVVRIVQGQPIDWSAHETGGYRYDRGYWYRSRA